MGNSLHLTLQESKDTEKKYLVKHNNSFIKIAFFPGEGKKAGTPAPLDLHLYACLTVAKLGNHIPMIMTDP